MHIHIFGICGTFMGGLALIAREHGHTITGADQNIYPPMSTQLKAAGIKLLAGYDDVTQLQPHPDVVIVGNVMKRGVPVIEYVLNNDIPYCSGPAWLYQNVLKERQVLAVAGTHGKTTTTSMLAWILERAGLNPGFLIGGVASNFGISARLGTGKFFVIEADEYDTAFFDKQAKFLHYHPRTLILNNLEFDHGDIFTDLDAIKRMFHYLVRTVPGEALIVCNGHDENLAEVLACGVWTPCQFFDVKKNKLDHEAINDIAWSAQDISENTSDFKVVHEDKIIGEINWQLLGKHNISNALAAIAAANHVGVDVATACAALNKFTNVKRRLELIAKVNNISIYDDFAHHPTAIKVTLEALRAKVGKEARIWAVLEFGSNTMQAGQHSLKDIAASFNAADQVIILKPTWDYQKLVPLIHKPTRVLASIETIIAGLKKEAKRGDHILIMSNKSFAGIHKKLEQQLTITIKN